VTDNRLRQVSMAGILTIHSRPGSLRGGHPRLGVIPVAGETETKRGRGGGGLPPTTPTSAPHVVIQSDRRARDPITRGAPQTAWRLFGWFGLLLVVVGGSDILSQWYPPAFHSVELEFGTTPGTIASLPLLTIRI